MAGERAIAEEQRPLARLDRCPEAPVERVVAQQVRQDRGGRDVVHRRHLDLPIAERPPQEAAADASQSVDADAHGGAEV